MHALSQMPVILIPIHFDRDVVNRVPSCQHSVVLRPFITQDFMTGVPAIPGRHLPMEVCINLLLCIIEFRPFNNIVNGFLAGSGTNGT